MKINSKRKGPYGWTWLDAIYMTQRVRNLDVVQQNISCWGLAQSGIHERHQVLRYAPCFLGLRISDWSCTLSMTFYNHYPYLLLCESPRWISFYKREVSRGCLSHSSSPIPYSFHYSYHVWSELNHTAEATLTTAMGMELPWQHEKILDLFSRAGRRPLSLLKPDIMFSWKAEIERGERKYRIMMIV